MSRSNCTFTSVSYRYPGTPDPVFENLSFDLHGDWTGIVGENGAGKSTLLLLASKLIAPDRGTVASPSPAHLCLQRTDEPPAEMENFLYSGDNEAMRLMNLLSMDWDWLSRWGSLSHGERKRAQIAVALWLRPELLALDEPTNHLDSGAKELLVRALRTYGGTGLIVSHDRNVLDTLCARCVFLRSGRAVVRPGGVTDGLREEERERKEAERAHTEASRDYERIRKETEARRHIAEGSRNRVSKAGLKRGDKDGRGKINLARVTGKDAVGGRLYAEFESRLEQAGRRLEDAKAPPVRKTGVRLGALRSDSDFLFRSEPTELPLGDGKLLRLPALELRPSDRTALTGANGTGKSTLVRFIIGRTAVKPGAVLYIPQELDAENGIGIVRTIRNMEPAHRGEVLSRFSRLGSDPERLLFTGLPSPGETRKLLFALGVFSSPRLIVMDEPTNHLDLPSILLMEEALREVPCALLLVSHDRVFLEHLTHTEWRIHAETPRENIVEIIAGWDG